MSKLDFAQRIKRLTPYLFAKIQQILREKEQTGEEIISLSIGDPDLPPPSIILESLKEEAGNPAAHGYSSSRGETEFRETVSKWIKTRFGVDVNPEEEVAALLGSKEGIANVARAFINPGDRALVPNPAYPVYENGGVLLSGGIPISMPLLKENQFLPDLERINELDAKMMFLNYPNNPTGSVADRSFLKECVDFALDNDIILCYDNAYSEITYDQFTAPSILEIEGGREAAIEFHSCSKTFNMTGDRIAFAVGNSRLIEGLVKVKSQIDSGPSKYVQRAVIPALKSYQKNRAPEFIAEMNDTYQRRARVLVQGLCEIGLKCDIPKATFYVWTECGGDSMEFTRKLIEAGVVATPGVGFGKYGEGYIRFSLTRPIQDIQETVKRIAQIQWKT
ncbi:MAG: aminotransferase class I/II-fold pyridoxal phosphate-dependent enzyme [Kosmotogaceae bacterium]